MIISKRTLRTLFVPQLLVVAFVALLVGFAPPSASAASTALEQTRQLEEVVVTARKREERLIDVPAALSSLGDEDLNRYMTREITDIGDLVPGLEISYSSTGQGGLFRLRGLGSVVDAGVENMVALNFDGIQVNTGRFLRAAMFDLDSINVLKGPQALFFGKNSPGGVLAFNSADPGDVVAGYATFGLADEPGKQYVEGAITVPITDTLSTRFAIRYDSEDGWLNNVGGPMENPFECLPQPGPCVHPITRGPAQGDVRDLESLFGRVSIAWDPTESFSALFKLMMGKYEDNGDVVFQRYCQGDHPVVTAGGITAIDTNADCRIDFNTTLGTWPVEVAANWPELLDGGKPQARFEPILTSLTLEHDWRDFTFTSVTGYYEYDAPNTGNSDVTTFTIYGGDNSLYGDAFSQELRVASNFAGPVNFLFGLFYEDSWKQYRNNGRVTASASAAKIDVGNGQGYDSRTGRPNDWLQRSTTETETFSVFGQVIWDITDRLTLEAGARWLDEHKDAEVMNVYVNDSIIEPVRNAVFLPEGVSLADTIDETNLSPEVTLSFRPVDNITLYGSYKSGYQAGGMSNPGLPPPLESASALVYDSTEADGFELGFKFDFPNIVSGDIIAYDYEYKDLQVQSGRLVEAAPGIVTVLYTITNAATASLKGIEMQANWTTPIEGLSALTNLAYNEAKYERYPGAACFTGAAAAGLCDPLVGADLSGATLPHAPQWEARLGVGYDRQLTSDLGLSLAIAGTFYDEIYFDQPNSTFVNIPEEGVRDQRRESFWLYDASARLFWRDRWEAALIVRNLTDKLYVTRATSVLAAPTPSDLSVTVGQPRTITFQVSMFL